MSDYPVDRDPCVCGCPKANHTGYAGMCEDHAECRCTAYRSVADIARNAKIAEAAMVWYAATLKTTSSYDAQVVDGVLFEVCRRAKEESEW